MKTYKIEVTAEDIKNGKRGSCSSCPIALSLKRITNENLGVSELDIYNIYTGDSLCNLPEIGKRFVSDFDDNQPVSPFTFEIEVDL